MASKKVLVGLIFFSFSEGSGLGKKLGDFFYVKRGGEGSKKMRGRAKFYLF